MNSSNDDISTAKQMVTEYVNRHTETEFSKTIRSSFEKVATVIIRKRRNIEAAKKMIEENKITPASIVKEGVCSKSRMFHKGIYGQPNYLNDFVREAGKKINLICINEAEYMEKADGRNHEIEQLRKLKDCLDEKEMYITLLKKELMLKDPGNKLLNGIITDRQDKKTHRAIENAIENMVSDVKGVEVKFEDAKTNAISAVN